MQFLTATFHSISFRPTNSTHLKNKYNLTPFVEIYDCDNQIIAGWQSIIAGLNTTIRDSNSNTFIVAVECYQGVNDDELLTNFTEGLKPNHIIRTEELMFSSNEIHEITYPDVTDHRIFGYMTRLTIKDFIDPSKLFEAKKSCVDAQGLILIYGPGAVVVEPNPDLLIYADMARWEIQLRMRRHATHNLGLDNHEENIETQYKRGYFVDWRVCDRLKKELFYRIDYLLDTNKAGEPKMITRMAFHESMNQLINQPFSVVPYFDKGPWGGYWMKEKFNLPENGSNYAWCFNCVPEENSLLLKFGKHLFEMPSVNLVFSKPAQLLGEAVHARFGDEFPIRFDYLDTMGGGNLSLQVHPLTEYIREKFGVPYTQDESYYMLDADEDAQVFLGLKENIDASSLAVALKNSENPETPFNDQEHIQSWPAKRHDHFLIPGGTVHCSGKNSMVLEISATPYIFTFKLWDWGRMGLDGKPRPINIEHGLANIQWNRTTSWTRKNLVNCIEKISEGEGWVEERTGLHEREFIETRRHWFTGEVLHNTQGNVNVLCLIEGSRILVESPSGTFKPFTINYGEVFIVPATVGEYIIKPAIPANTPFGTIKAFVRTNA